MLSLIDAVLVVIIVGALVITLGVDLGALTGWLRRHCDDSPCPHSRLAVANRVLNSKTPVRL